MMQAPSLLGVAFFPPHGGGILPVRNTFIHFEDGRPTPGELFRSSTWPRGSCLEEAVSWEAATQVLCHAMAPQSQPEPRRSETFCPSDSTRFHSSPSASSLASGTAECIAVDGPLVAEGARELQEASGELGAGWTEVARRGGDRRRRPGGAKAEELPPASGAGWGQAPSPMRAHRLAVGIEDEPHFQAVRRLIGPAGAHVKSIVEASGGAKVWVSGRGASRAERGRGAASAHPEGPLTVCIASRRPESLALATELVKARLAALKAEHRRFLQHGGAADGRAADGPGWEWSKTGQRVEYHCSLPVGIPQDGFQVFRRLVGSGGQNMRHIASKARGARIHVCPGKEDAAQELAISVRATSWSSFECARGLVEDLLGTVRAEYKAFSSKSGADLHAAGNGCLV